MIYRRTVDYKAFRDCAESLDMGVRISPDDTSKVEIYAGLDWNRFSRPKKDGKDLPIILATLEEIAGTLCVTSIKAHSYDDNVKAMTMELNTPYQKLPVVEPQPV